MQTPACEWYLHTSIFPAARLFVTRQQHDMPTHFFAGSLQNRLAHSHDAVGWARGCPIFKPGIAPALSKNAHLADTSRPCSIQPRYPSMQKETKESPRLAVVAAVQLPSVSDIEFAASLTELRELAKTLGFQVIHTFTQKRNSFEKTAYLGVGKREDIRRFIKHDLDEQDIDGTVGSHLDDRPDAMDDAGHPASDSASAGSVNDDENAAPDSN